MSNRFVVILLVCVVAFGGIFWFSKSKNKSDNGSNGTSQGQPSNHVRGAGNKNVTLVEYGDFQCPACGQYYPLVKQIEEKYKDDIKFQFRNFPLVQIHQNAMAAHRAAEAAHKQNKFWEMYDALYSTQKEWESSNNPSSYFEQIAQQLNLDMTKFKQDSASAEVNAIINADISEGQKLGANSTPTFFINGKKVEENPRDLEGFSKLIDEAAKQQ